MTAPAQQILANTFDTWSDAVCEAIGRLEDKNIEPPDALFHLDRFLKGDRLKLAVLALHREGAPGHGCCFHTPGELGHPTHACCLPDPTAPNSVGDWVLTKEMGDKLWFLAVHGEHGYGWTVPDAPEVLRFTDENCARLYRSWHHRGDATIHPRRLERRLVAVLA